MINLDASISELGPALVSSKELELQHDDSKERDQHKNETKESKKRNVVSLQNGRVSG